MVPYFFLHTALRSFVLFFGKKKRSFVFFSSFLTTTIAFPSVESLFWPGPKTKPVAAALSVLLAPSHSADHPMVGRSRLQEEMVYPSSSDDYVVAKVNINGWIPYWRRTSVGSFDEEG